MNKYFGDQHRRGNDGIFNQIKNLPDYHESQELSSDMVMDELRNILFAIDVILLATIPALTWYLTGRILAPVQRAHEREKQFLTDASHDLRTPLTVLNGEIEIALQKKRTNAEYITLLRSNQEELNELIALVENMLFFARENQQQSVQKEEIDLTDILTERIAAFQKFAKMKNIQITFSPPKQSVVFSGNQQLLKRLFTILFDNAVKYTPFEGKIKVKLSQKKDTASIEVSDTGIGIPKEQQEKVFDRFFRADTSRTEKGFGLGLSIAKKIVTFHQGEIHLTSEVGKGTKITILLPI